MDTTEILIRIRKIVRSIDMESKKIQKEYGVSIPQVLCLNYLSQSPGFQSTQGAIRKFMNLNPSTVSGIVNRLEIKNLIARLPRTGDKRVVNIILTSRGSKLLEHIPPLLHEQLDKKLKKLEQKKIRQIEETLNFLIGLLDIQDVEAFPLITLEDNLEQENVLQE
ncbi:MAG: MarR family winged helix-turn-helix transcriptional regulator [Mangrovibacterium sp.]